MKRFSLAALGFTMIGLTTAAPIVQAAKIYGIAEVAGAQRLVTWDSSNPSVLLSDVPITHLEPGETIRGMDFAPIDFDPNELQLFAIGVGGDPYADVYRIHRATGAA
ncbi:MAG: hypothetical protein DCC67_17595 [Planctomycetota bacterium]|nr:MAG: hypothetical protein DCC67_17595 [Planctomycetota bacterium]